MRGKILIGALLLALMAAAAWLYANPRTRGQAAHFLGQSSPTLRSQPQEQPAKTLRKCTGSAGPVYTDGACPPGSREQPLGGGTVTALPAPAAGTAVGTAAAPASAASARSLLRELAHPAGQTPLKDKMIDAIR